MFGKALLISLGAFICSYVFKDGKSGGNIKMTIAGVIVIVLFALFVIGIFL